MFKHSIIVVDLSGREETYNEKKFKQMFSKDAQAWFDSNVTTYFPAAKKINDNSLVRYHYDVDDLIFELR
jgi:hypothetical protein